VRRVQTSLIELRVLEGPNLYFPRAAVKLTLDLRGLGGLAEADAHAFAARIGLRNPRPGAQGSGFRQRFASRAVARLVRQVAAESGIHRLAVRVRVSSDVDRLIVAYPWRHRVRATALGEAVAGVLDALPTADLDAVVAAAAARVAEAELGGPPRTVRPHVPVVAVTGTNGKTTTSRMVAHIGRRAGLHVGWSSTDGIFVDGALAERGDYSGPSGAGRVLAHEQVQLAVTETARGGILLRGIGVTHNDVSVVTNVSADHLGLHGIDSVDQLAEVKAVVTRITRPDGWCVLNADDPRVLAMRAGTKARVWVFSRDADSPAIREVLSAGGRAITMIDGWVSVLERGDDPDPLVEVVDVPMTLAGLSQHNVENALAAAAAALGAGLPRSAVVEGLRTFHPGPELNPGRMNVYTLGEVTVVVDLAHNEAGLEALLQIMDGVRPPGGRLLLGLGSPGDRTDEIVRGLGELAARRADEVLIVHKDRYLRGRDADDLAAQFRAGAAAVGVTGLDAVDTELGGLQELVRRARPHDVVAVMCHQDRDQLQEWLAARGATVDGPDELRAKVRLSAPPGDRPAGCGRS